MEHTPWPRAPQECGTRVTSVMLAPPRWVEHQDQFVYIGMPCRYTRGDSRVQIGPFGKPWACRNDPRGWREAYRSYLKARLRTDAAFRAAVAGLHGKTLVCFCKGSKRGEDADCHGDLLATAAEYLHHKS